MSGAFRARTTTFGDYPGDMSESDPREGGNPGWAASEADLRLLEVEGYRSAQQLRTIDKTRALVAAGWDLMAAHPAEPLRLDEVLGATGASASTFYSRFDSVHALIEVAGLLSLTVADRARAAEACRAPVGLDRPGGAVVAATRRTLAPLLEPGVLPREVLAAGAWSDAYATAHHRSRVACVQALARDLTADGAVEHPSGEPYPRLLTWLHLTSALADQTWLIGGLTIDRRVFVEQAALVELLGRLVFAPDDAARRTAEDVGRAGIEAPPRPALAGHSDRSARAIAELRTATREHLVTHGRDLSIAAIAASVHRSRSAFFDAFGSLGAALADLARAEQTARIPTELFRPRPDVAPEHLVAHIARRIRAWQDHQGIVGRRLLQAAGDHPELAAEVAAQVLDSDELLTAWYASAFSVPPPLVRLLFLALLTSEQHQVLWGPVPPVVIGPEAVAALFAPIVA